jgi:hypothetical protein
LVVHCLSRMAIALRWAGENNLVDLPRSRPLPGCRGRRG